jgi:hypothetical protein
MRKLALYLSASTVLFAAIRIPELSEFPIRRTGLAMAVLLDFEFLKEI